MLGRWRSHDEYQEFVCTKFKPRVLLREPSPNMELLEYADIISKLFIIDTDRLKFIMEHCYSDKGRPAEQQPEIFRTFILMQHLHIPVSEWVQKLNYNSVLRTACGFCEGEVPSIASFYNFIDRLDGPKVASRVKNFLSKPRKNSKKEKSYRLNTPISLRSLKTLSLKAESLMTPPTIFSMKSLPCPLDSQ
jgi:hypothetical protein